MAYFGSDSQVDLKAPPPYVPQPMSHFAVTQQIHFCYGHRLLNYNGKCAHLHGHNASVELTFEKSTLDAMGMVIDFNEIKSKLKTWVEETLDHKMMLQENDPIAQPIQDLGEPIFLMNGNPTAENIAKLLYEKAESFELPVVQVKVWETPTQFATYRK